MARTRGPTRCRRQHRRRHAARLDVCLHPRLRGGRLYNAANRLKTVSYEGNLKGTYVYNGLEQLITRVISNSGSADGTIHTVHDRAGNVIAETDAAGAIVREYIWLPGAGHAGTDLPLAVIDNVNTPTPQLYHVHADHLGRPMRMTDASKATAWQATWLPWGAPYQITGALALEARFPGQWYQLEAGLHYNWHRHYDPTVGRYTQPDPLGFVDGPSVYGYARGQPLQAIDPDGQWVSAVIGGVINAGAQFTSSYIRNGRDAKGAFRCIDWGDVFLSGFFRGIGGPSIVDLFLGRSPGRTLAGLGLSAFTKKWLTPVPVTIGNYGCECSKHDGMSETIPKFFQ